MILCKLGFHKWFQVGEVAKPLLIAILITWTRKCSRCEKLQRKEYLHPLDNLLMFSPKWEDVRLVKS